MGEELPTIGWYERQQAQMEWERGRAREFCRGGESCPGPSVSNISFGPDGGGHMIIAACNAACAECIRHGMPTSAWVTHPEAWLEELEAQRKELKKVA